MADKQTPVCSRLPPYDEHYAFLRARIDITPFQKKVSSLPAEMWEDDFQEGNVKLTRPAHDKWGIKKIVFTFCDDFLLKVIDLPWSRDEAWRACLLPIYAAIGVEESQIVRSLLASMPPNLSIPIHHDTGHWVKHTHRIHVPIITSEEEVDFLVGPTEASMRKVLFCPGTVIELNNQAKHAVTNRMPSTWRVHLIFDYVERDYFPPLTRYALQPGEKVFQTRRSIDLAREMGARKAPTYLILGAQKCGTTSLHHYISQHPLMIAGRRRETHYFDWRWNSTLTSDEEHYDFYTSTYFHAEVLKTRPSLHTGESTPSYLLHSSIVIPRIQRILPWVKLLVLLRNPVDRAWSQYQMCISTEGTPEQKKTRGMSSYIGRSFGEIVREEMKELIAAGITADCGEEAFERYIGSLPMGHGGHSIVLRGCYALQLRPWMKAFPSSSSSLSLNENNEEIEPQLMIRCIGDLKGSPEQVSETMQEVFRFLHMPPHTIEDVEAKNSRSYECMEDEIRKELTEFYAPYNSQLWKLLGRNFEESW